MAAPVAAATRAADSPAFRSSPAATLIISGGRPSVSSAALALALASVAKPWARATGSPMACSARSRSWRAARAVWTLTSIGPSRQGFDGIGDWNQDRFGSFHDNLAEDQADAFTDLLEPAFLGHVLDTGKGHLDKASS
ncbi:hypothetical protein PG995_007708 [Apiospora arundinis]